MNGPVHTYFGSKRYRVETNSGFFLSILSLDKLVSGNPRDNSNETKWDQILDNILIFETINNCPPQFIRLILLFPVPSHSLGSVQIFLFSKINCLLFKSKPKNQPSSHPFLLLLIRPARSNDWPQLLGRAATLNSLLVNSCQVASGAFLWVFSTTNAVKFGQTKDWSFSMKFLLM